MDGGSSESHSRDAVSRAVPGCTRNESSDLELRGSGVVPGTYDLLLDTGHDPHPAKPPCERNLHFTVVTSDPNHFVEISESVPSARISERISCTLSRRAWSSLRNPTAKSSVARTFGRI